VEKLRKPDFNNLLKVLNREAPDRPTLFEFFLNSRLYEKLAGKEIASMKDELASKRLNIHAFHKAGYDYATVGGSKFHFPVPKISHIRTISLNERSIIHDRKSFDEYPWPDPDEFDYSSLDTLKDELPDGMKLIVCGAGGVLENVIALTGFDNLCYMLYEDPELVGDIFEAVGSRFVRYYEICSKYDSVGALISNDDWGFNHQTMISPKDLRKYVYPWHKRIVEVIHESGKPAILHSCGNFNEIMDDVIDYIKYDGKHSYEDKIIPVEDAYEKWGGRIAILGGIDVDFMVNSTPDEINRRSKQMLERSATRGGYALGTGNSVPEYIPDENYFAMISAAVGNMDRYL
jgi:uroporphyrinogen decarboxylase